MRSKEEKSVKQSREEKRRKRSEERGGRGDGGGGEKERDDSECRGPPHGVYYISPLMTEHMLSVYLCHVLAKREKEMESMRRHEVSDEMEERGGDETPMKRGKKEVEGRRKEVENEIG